jgi:hypothetical protein
MDNYMTCPKCASLHVSQNWDKFGIPFASTFCFDCDQAYGGIVLVKPRPSGKIAAWSLFVERNRYNNLPKLTSDKDYARAEIADAWDAHIDANLDEMSDAQRDDYWTDFWQTVESYVHVG